MPREYPGLEELFSGEGWESPSQASLLALQRLLELGTIRVEERDPEGGGASAAAPVALGPGSRELSVVLPPENEGALPRRVHISLKNPARGGEEHLLLLLGWTLRREAEIRQAKRSLARLEEESLERARERERWLHFFSVTVHDLKAPVSAVLNYLKTVLRKGQQSLDERLVQMLRRSIIRLDSMLDLISGLLELARLESGSAEEPFVPVDVEGLLSGCTELAHELAMPKDIKVGLAVKRPLPSLIGSELRLNQMLMNLLTNAVKYTPPRGKVVLRAAGEGEELVLQVEDDGVGIPPEHLPRVFEEFYRADPGEEGGTGLGLSIARRIVEMHGGSITLKSPITPEGRGTRVTVRLPLKGAADGSGVAEQVTPTQQGGK